MMTLFYLFE